MIGLLRYLISLVNAGVGLALEALTDEGALEGLTLLGRLDGRLVGMMVRDLDGIRDEGVMDDATGFLLEGAAVGLKVGRRLGIRDGDRDGTLLRATVGTDDLLLVGLKVGRRLEGEIDFIVVGSLLGWRDGA
jgi:hypothetical protein